jgi:hypothetical protein
MQWNAVLLYSGSALTLIGRDAGVSQGALLRGLYGAAAGAGIPPGVVMKRHRFQRSLSPTSNAEEAAGPAVTAASLFTSLPGCRYRRHCQPYSWVALPVQQLRSNDSGDDVVMMMGGRCSLAHASQLQTR